MTLNTYLPQDRLRALARGETLPDRTTGSALFADISGFTPLTEGLRDSLGPRRGAEELTKHLDTVYTALITEIERYGGSVIGFAGDAVTCWFDGTSDANQRAVACAFALQQVMEAFKAIALPNGTTTELALKVAVASGPARRFVVGDPSIHYMDALAGATVARTSTGEHLSERGDVLLDEATTETVGSAVVIKEWREDHESGERFAVVQGLGDRGQGLEGTDPQSPPPEVPLEQLRDWLHKAQVDREQSFLTEFRPCAALFVRFSGIDYDSDEAEKQLDSFVRQMQTIVNRYEGTVIQLTIGDKGSYAYINFGALSMHEDDARRAVKTALDLKKSAERLGFLAPLQMGITQGILRVGPYGGKTRKTFGALGDEVNLAARLMTSAAEGEILVSGPVHKAIANDVVSEPRAPLLTKGKAEPLPVFEVSGEKQQRAIRLQEPVYALPMVGRTNELQIINDKLELALEGKSQVVAIVAEAGLGKSRLVAEVIRSARRKGFIGFGGACQSDSIHTPYQAWKRIWQAFFSIDPDMNLIRQIRNLESEIEDRAPLRVDAMPLLNIVLELNLPENDFTQNLEPKIRQSALHALLEDCLKAMAKDDSILIIIEDLHWIDALSHDLLESLAKTLANYRVVLLVAYRPPQATRLETPRLEALVQFTKIELHELTQAEAESVVRAKLTQLYPYKPALVGALPAGLVDMLMARTQGNPFYLEELLNYVRDRGLDTADIQNIELPDSLHTLILSRIDQLSEQEKTTLRVASIVGRLFRAKWLTGYYPELGSFTQVKASLDVLEKLDITPLDSPEPELAYLFKHIVTHEVTYESLLFATRTKLHEQLARYLENADAPVETIAFHYGRSNNAEKQREYYRKAGEAAQKNFANDAALDYFKMLLPLLKDEKEKALIHLKRGQVYELIGRWDETESDFRTALNLAKDEMVLKANAQYALGKLSGLRGDYAPALDWLIQAQEVRTKLGDTAGLAQVLIERGVVLYLKGEYEQAREPLNEGLALAREVDDKLSTALALNKLGIVSKRQGNYPIAQALQEESLALRRAMGDKAGIAGSLNNLGNVAYEQGDYLTAQALYEEGLALDREMGNKAGIANTLGNLGNVAMAQGEYATARASHEESLVLRREIGDKVGISIALNNLGNVMGNQGDLSVSWELHEESLALKREIGDKAGIAISLGNLGNVAMAQGEYATARALHEEGLRLYQEMGNKWGIAMLLCNLGLVTQLQGEYAAARAYFEESLALCSEIDEKTIMAYALLGLGLTDLAENKPEAREHILTSLSMRQETGEQLGQTSSLIGMAGLAFLEGNPHFAAQVLGAVKSALKALKAVMEAEFKPFHDQTVARVKEQLGAAEFRSAWEEGAKWSLEETVKRVLEEVE